MTTGVLHGQFLGKQAPYPQSGWQYRCLLLACCLVLHRLHQMPRDMHSNLKFDSQNVAMESHIMCVLGYTVCC